jgi:hypothetical protein
VVSCGHNPQIPCPQWHGERLFSKNNGSTGDEEVIFNVKRDSGGEGGSHLNPFVDFTFV